MNSFNSTATSLLQGLGKSTRRGIKKCFKCGVYNGTRGSFCKNKQCGISLKSLDDQKFDSDAVKLSTGTVRQVYSVRVKDSLLECRGFVQLSLLQDNANVALCFVDSCQRSFDNSILKCHEEGSSNVETELCDHIKLVLKSQTIAKPINFNINILSELKIKMPTEIKDKLKALASDNDSPLVQQVSRDVMAVKCQVTPKQPLGYLHFTFVKGRSKSYEKCYCSCTEYHISVSHDKSTTIKYKCIHYYACIAALSSDQKYMEEFSYFINGEINSQNKINILSMPKVAREITPVDVKRNKIMIMKNQLIKKPKILKKEVPKSTVKKQKYIIKRCKKIVPKIYPIEIKVLNEASLTKNADNGVNWTFLDWLAFVTESINKTMQFINCGIINTQVFYIPKLFFLSFKDRIPENYVEQKTDIGSVFYRIMNVNQVKEIFDTPKVKLRIAKKFIHNELNGFIEYDESSSEESNTQYHSSFIFFLNVGQSTVDESDNFNNAFIIEWLPNICSVTEIGQLKVQYKYGKKSI
ncbi:unnamed protein product [Ceutorhynchus assimilis]|uniref:SWIM-type domain-containing protein n=1 Tax=Ceutorhynchus assimilis TaxID=467358 RepID=A0A9N9Q995_9CUCU|nr:unnamed protein product [Ceutorhynchus assimilis]